jgi:hypothetical protein
VPAIATNAVPTRNTFNPLATDDSSSVDSGPPPTLDDAAPSTQAIDAIFRDANATLTAATYDFDFLLERL